MSELSSVKRSYSSPRRTEQANRTRRAILDAAAQLFVESGYGSTSLQQIADGAGVAVQTIYSSFGNKQRVMAELLDFSIAGDDEPVAVNDRDWMQIVFNDPNPAVRIHAYANAVAGIYERAGDIFNVLIAAADADAGLAPLAAETEQRRRTGAASVVAGLVTLDGLQDGLTESCAVDILWTLNSPDVYRRLVTNSQWSLADYKAWLAITITQAIT